TQIDEFHFVVRDHAGHVLDASHVGSSPGGWDSGKPRFSTLFGAASKACTSTKKQDPCHAPVAPTACLSRHSRAGSADVRTTSVHRSAQTCKSLPQIGALSVWSLPSLNL